jgi:hypothetical protein
VDDDQLRRATNAVDDTLSAELHAYNGGRVLKWVATFEYLDTYGERQIATMASPDLMKWDVEGMLRHVLKNDDLDTLRQMFTDGGDDDAVD